MARVLRIDELEPISVAGVRWRPLRRELGVTAFGVNAYSAGAGEQLIEPHNETGGAGHEEMYLVVSGRATFTVDGEEFDAPVGTVVFVPDPGSRRSAVARQDATTAIVVGGARGTIKPSAWEYYFAAQPAIDAGDPGRAYEIAAAGLDDHPDHAGLQYNLACFASLAGQSDRAVDHLARAVALDPAAREWAATDPDLDAIRADPRYPG